MARQIGSGDWLLGPDQLQNDISIDAAGSLAGTKLDIRQINKPHTPCPLVRLHRKPS
jgi:hypothetical protein